jgi:hypothetical protein
MRLLKALIHFIVATVVGALGSQVLGVWGALLGALAGGLASWWVVRRYFAGL